MNFVIYTLSLLILSSACYAQSERFICNGPIAPCKEEKELVLWFAKLKSKIKKQPSYEKIERNLVQYLNSGDKYICYILPSTNGTIRRSKVVPILKDRNSIDKGEAPELIKLIKNCELSDSPNNLPFIHGLRIDFSRVEGRISITFGLSRYCEARIGEKQTISQD